MVQLKFPTRRGHSVIPVITGAKRHSEYRIQTSVIEKFIVYELRVSVYPRFSVIAFEAAKTTIQST